MWLCLSCLHILAIDSLSPIQPETVRIIEIVLPFVPILLKYGSFVILFLLITTFTSVVISLGIENELYSEYKNTFRELAFRFLILNFVIGSTLVSFYLFGHNHATSIKVSALYLGGLIFALVGYLLVLGYVFHNSVNNNR